MANTIVYTDEIYNVAEVRRDLEARGHRFPLRARPRPFCVSTQWGSDQDVRL
jgi:hypothetical protein